MTVLAASPSCAACKWSLFDGWSIWPFGLVSSRIVLNGSFVTGIMEPNDVDCVLLIGRGFPTDPVAETELRAGLPFLDMALVRRRRFDSLVNVVFATDRFNAPKGMVEVIP